ncbi:hypothetical protein DENSPDRAFT_313344 [Dentipellis sp. KUC8613]|nr:hypothetical protein DENSPDRAFT_313344 [Dentipellis sp. KUC8613]
MACWFLRCGHRCGTGWAGHEDEGAGRRSGRGQMQADVAPRDAGGSVLPSTGRRRLALGMAVRIRSHRSARQIRRVPLSSVRDSERWKHRRQQTWPGYGGSAACGDGNARSRIEKVAACEMQLCDCCRRRATWSGSPGEAHIAPFLDHDRCWSASQGQTSAYGTTWTSSVRPETSGRHRHGP